MAFLREIPQPLASTRDDLHRVMRLNQPPLLSQQDMLELLQLSGSQPDGKSLADRLLNSKKRLD